MDDKTYRKKLCKRIEKCKNKEMYKEIHEIISKNKEIFNVNSNGVFFDIYKLSVKSIKKISQLLEKQIIDTTETEDSLTYNNYSSDNVKSNFII